MQTFERWIALPENRLARAAADLVAEAAATSRATRGLNPLFLHGPAGSGKSHLAGALVSAVTARAPDRIAAHRSAGDLVLPRNEESADANDLADLRAADLMLLDDVHRLPERAFEALVNLLDRGLARGQYWIMTATDGPARLTRLPGRLTSRMASGLVVGLDRPSPASRLAILATMTDQRGLSVPADVLGWLAEQVAGSFRELEGALNRLEALARLHGGLVTLEMVREEFQTDSETRRATVERIAQSVGRYFRVDPRQLQGPSRMRGVLLPRQVGMYLTRRLTALSLEQIGAYFGGRDHSTVLHACRKVEEALEQDAVLSGAVRELQADLV